MDIQEIARQREMWLNHPIPYEINLLFRYEETEEERERSFIQQIRDHGFEFDEEEIKLHVSRINALSKNCGGGLVEFLHFIRDEDATILVMSDAAAIWMPQEWLRTFAVHSQAYKALFPEDER